MCALPIAGYIMLRPDPRGLRAARERVRDLLGKLEFGEDESARLLIAVGEAISNAYLHGSPDRPRDLIRLGWETTGRELVITIRDNGDGFGTGRTHCPIGDRGRLARGLELMRAGADEVGFAFDTGGKVVLRKRVNLIPPGPSPLGSE